jgi:hypothetical protein
MSDVLLCHAIPSHATPCHAMLSHAMPCHVRCHVRCQMPSQMPCQMPRQMPCQMWCHVSHVRCDAGFERQVVSEHTHTVLSWNIK